MVDIRTEFGYWQIGCRRFRSTNLDNENIKKRCRLDSCISLTSFHFNGARFQLLEANYFEFRCLPYGARSSILGYTKLLSLPQIDSFYEVTDVKQKNNREE